VRRSHVEGNLAATAGNELAILQSRGAKGCAAGISNAIGTVAVHDHQFERLLDPDAARGGQVVHVVVIQRRAADGR